MSVGGHSELRLKRLKRCHVLVIAEIEQRVHVRGEEGKKRYMSVLLHHLPDFDYM